MLSAALLTCHWLSVDHSVFQVQTPGRGWTLVCQSSLPALPCLTWQRVNPTTSVCDAATPPVWARPLYPQGRSRSEINWVRLYIVCWCHTLSGQSWTVWPKIYNICLLSNCFLPALCSVWFQSIIFPLCSPQLVLFPFFLPYFLTNLFLNRPALSSGQSSGDQEHRHLSGGLLGGV